MLHGKSGVYRSRGFFFFLIIIIIAIIVIIIIIITVVVVAAAAAAAVVVVVVVIGFKGAIRDFFFFFFLQSPHSAANCLQFARSSGPGAIVCKSRATHPSLITCNMCYVPLGTKGQLSY